MYVELNPDFVDGNPAAAGVQLAINPVLNTWIEGGPDTAMSDRRPLPMLVWRFAEPVWAISSGPFGGGIGPRNWIMNVTVPAAYARLDPDVHLAELADQRDLGGPGVGLLTAVDVTEAVTAVDAGVSATATVGIGHPAWAAAPDGHLRDAHHPGTINIVSWVPVPMSDAALINLVVTATEAKAQALWEHGVAATGTASDAICVACPATGRGAGAASGEIFGGPRSAWGARLARAVHGAVGAGVRNWRPGPDRIPRPRAETAETPEMGRAT